MFRNPLEERGGRVCNARNTFFFQKKFSPCNRCPQRVHVLCPHTGCTSCAPTRRAPVMGFSSLGKERGTKSELDA